MDGTSYRPGYAERPSRLIPLGVDVAAFHPDAAAGRAVKRDLGWSDGPPVVGFLGRFVREKGLKVLMDALDRVSTPWRAMFVGGGQGIMVDPVYRPGGDFLPPDDEVKRRRPAQ